MYTRIRINVIAFVVGIILLSCVNSESGGEKASNGKRKELKIEVLKEVPCAEEEKAKLTDVVRFHYKLSVEGHPTITDSTYTNEEVGKTGVVYMLQKGMTLKGFLKGMPGMCIGEIRRLTMPPHLAFGSRETEDGIPGGSTLIYDVELLDIKEPDEVLDKFYKADLNGDGVLDVGELEDVLNVAFDRGNFPLPNNPEVREAMLSQLFLHADKDKDGGMSVEEFKALLKLGKTLIQKGPKGPKKAPKSPNTHAKPKEEL